MPGAGQRPADCRLTRQSAASRQSSERQRHGVIPGVLPLARPRHAPCTKRRWSSPVACRVRPSASTRIGQKQAERRASRRTRPLSSQKATPPESRRNLLLRSSRPVGWPNARFGRAGFLRLRAKTAQARSAVGAQSASSRRAQSRLPACATGRTRRCEKHRCCQKEDGPMLRWKVPRRQGQSFMCAAPLLSHRTRRKPLSCHRG